MILSKFGITHRDLFHREAVGLHSNEEWNGALQEVNLLQDAIPHIFLPKKTPQVEQDNMEDIDLFLLQSFANSFKNTLTEVPFPQLDSVNGLLEKWMNIYPRSEDNQSIERFRQEVKSLENGETLPIYVRKQNCTLLITKRGDAHVELATFRSSLPSEMVMSTVGSHSLSFPETTEMVLNTEILHSEAFSAQLHELCLEDIEISLGKTPKGGHEYVETRDVANPRLVSDWIVGLLVPDPQQNNAASGQMITQIRKKIRDQVTFCERSSGSIPFRRSGMYMSLKAALQLKIVENLDSNLALGTYVYKLIMLRILADVAGKLSKEKLVDLDLSAQVLAKLGMRIRKLEDFKTELLPEEVKAVVGALKDNCLNHTKFIVRELKEKMDAFWATISSEKKKTTNRNSGFPKQPGKSNAAGRKVDYSKDLEHEIPTLDAYIEKLKRLLSQPEATGDNKSGNELKSVERYLTAEKIISGSDRYSYYSRQESDEITWLHDTENYIKYHCKADADGASVIHKILSKYAVKAMKVYQKDPVGMSQLILVTLKGLELLDRVATAKSSFLWEYTVGIKAQPFEHLLLPYKQDMALLEDLLAYFVARDREAIRSGNGILGRSVDWNDFTVRFAKEDPGMKLLRDRILADTEKEIEEKYKEIERCREECKVLQEKIRLEAFCKCEYKTNHWRNKWGKWRTSRHKVSTCEKCILESRLESQRQSVSRYERKLPQQETFQWAVVFELAMPEDYALWRDFLAFFKYEILGESIFGGESNGNLSMKWMNYSKLSSYSSSRGTSRKLQLGSQSQPASNTYHTRTQNLDALVYSNEDYIIYNGMGCNFHYENAGTPIKCVKTACSFQLKDASGSTPYLNLQDTLTSTTHTQNNVISRQNEYNEKLTLTEFVAYGSLRAGHRIQLRNLYEAIYSGTISLEQESVLALILQTIWQVGSRNENNERESHSDFHDNEFATEFLDMLDKLVRTNEANYSNSQILLTAVLIARRIGDLNQDMHQTCYEKLRKWRTIMDKWIKKMVGDLDKPEGSNISGESGVLKQNLLDVILCSLSSYAISNAANLNQVMKDEQDIVHWFQTIYQYKRNINGDQFGASTFMKSLLNTIKTLPLRLGLNDKIEKKDPAFERSLHSFICQLWNKAERLELKGVQFPNDQINGSVVQLEYQEGNLLAFDIVQGSFLVNGFAQSVLPSEVKGDKLFQRYFKDTTYLRTQQDNEWVTRTVTPFRGRHYEFHRIQTTKSYHSTRPSVLYSSPRRSTYRERYRHYGSSDDDSDHWNYRRDSSDDSDDYMDCYEPSYSHSISYGSYSTTNVDLVIKEIQDSSSSFVLLDPGNLSDSISDFFITNYSHWLDTSTNLIYFRPDAPSMMDKLTPHHFILELTQIDAKNIWKLKDVRTNEYILTLNSSGFKLATESLARLEMSKFINVTMNQERVRTAYLRRYNLRFVLKDNGYHESVEYRGFTVCGNQYTKGTLVGLQQGLLLENNIRHLLLIPHGSIQVSDGVAHQMVGISLKHLQQPPCFVYEYDNVLKRLKAHNSKSAWLYLAALHAATSSPLPDPFTRVTGTEMAVRIIQSADVWSCSPYDKESKAILEFISGLSPKRKYYGRSPSSNKKKPQEEEKGQMEIVEWPEGLSSMAAYDGFAIIVESLLKESEKLSALHGIANEKKPEKDELIQLCRSHVFLGYKAQSRASLNEPSSYSEKLRIRAYMRYLSFYNPLVAVQNPTYFTSAKLAMLSTNHGATWSLPFRQSSEKLDLNNLLTISSTRLAKSITPLLEKGCIQKNNLISFLIKASPLDSPLPGISLRDNGALRDLLYLDFRREWLKLYTMAINCKSEEEVNTFTVILTAAAYRGASMEQISNLHCIAHSASTGSVTFPSVPCLENLTVSPRSAILSSVELRMRLKRKLGSCDYPNPTCNEYENSIVEEILKRHLKPFTEAVRPTSPSYDHRDYTKYIEERKKYEEDLLEYRKKEEEYIDKIRGNCAGISRQIRALVWPCEKIENAEVGKLIESHSIQSRPVIQDVEEQLSVWYKNYKLKLFVDDVQSILNRLYDDFNSQSHDQVTKYTLDESSTRVLAEKPSERPITMEELMDESLAQKREEAETIFKTGKVIMSENARLASSYSTRKQFCQAKANEIIHDIQQMISGSTAKEIILQTGVAPRLDPISMLKYATGIPADNVSSERKIIREYAGSLGVLWTHIMQSNRCIRAKNPSELERETSNPGHQNWSPAENPEWLLLELELDIMIRPVQVDVAKQMISMPNKEKRENGENGVTQLNMGEGKTSVIVPMLCTSLAKKGSQLCRVTVLSSMFNMNLASLTFAIGGLLNRRVYSIPCRRDLEIDDKCVETIGEVYRECLELQGVVLTLPEYRLSFRLLAYDKMLKMETRLGLKMLGIENWLRNFARDVLDESDELFSVKYQLVYTIGEHVSIDGKDLRWNTCQRILEIIQKLGPTFLAKHGTNAVEFGTDTDHPHEFSTFRLLSNSCMDEFLDLVAERALEEFTLLKTERAIVKKFLTQQEISREDHWQVMESIFKETPTELNKILLLSGYLKRGILGLALTKRWRVEYGVNPKQGKWKREMAVPFRAKDVAAEKTEFGHPDLAIILTHLSYYYSGLSDKQLQETFSILKEEKTPEAIYSSWVANIPATPPFLQKYKSLNMKDFAQKAKLFDLLRKHKAVIDFWLANSVLPRECKQFKGKLVMTAWDLCYERQRFPVTGFSGTNDSKILLPLMISQQDLSELENTNAEMETTLLQPENANHKGFEMGVTCTKILETMKEDNLSVLIDAGALMLELSNEKVAELWLEVNTDIEAAVYFSEENDLLVKCKGSQGVDTPFNVSPYQGRLEKCGVFLDDQHTRGTDFKFPDGSKACVTVGTRMKRDKLIQACMRMRKLGQGHSVTFYLSHEAFGKVMKDEVDTGDITTRKVLDWVCENTKESNENGLLYWALAGRNYAQRLAAEDNFHFPLHKTLSQVNTEDGTYDQKANVLANQSVDDEIIDLKDMYGQFTQTELLTKLIPKWFRITKRKLQMKSGAQEMSPSIWERFDGLCGLITGKVTEHAPEKEHVSSAGMMEEEQEKELELEKEREVEEERVVERPARAEEAVPHLHTNVKNLILNAGPIRMEGGGIVRLSEIFRTTTFWSEVQPDCWRDGVYATSDFITVIQGHAAAYHKTDDHLRPVQYMVSSQSLTPSGPALQLLVLSPFEVNELMPYFRSGQAKCKLHMFSLRRTENQDLLLNNPRLQMPSSLEGIVIPEGSRAAASLLLTSGSLYFISNQEQQAFLDFLGLVLQPWSTKQKEAIQDGMITKTGFLLPAFRKESQTGFDKDPTGLVNKILSCRHPVVSEHTHVKRLLEKKLKIEFPLSLNAGLVKVERM